MVALPELILTLTFATTGLAISPMPAQPQTVLMPLPPQSIRMLGAAPAVLNLNVIVAHQKNAQTSYQYAWAVDDRDPAMMQDRPTDPVAPGHTLGKGRANAAFRGDHEASYAELGKSVSRALHPACFRRGA